MKKTLTLAFLTISLFSCGKIENSSSLDEILYGEFSETGTPDFLITKAAINANCLNCHAVWRQYSAQDFVNANLVIPGDSANSKLYNRNLLATGPGVHNMPPSGNPPISTADLGAMINWINSL